ncbi:MAG: hypothetical protein ACRES2_04120 [Steroidobacteraceae bacterium]
MRQIQQTCRGMALVALFALPLCAAAAVAADAANPAAPMSDQQLIDSALSAAPAGLRHDAGVMAVDDKGAMRTLRESKNGFTCMPDAPTTPGPDPMCMDKASMEFVHAMLTKTAPPAGKIGLMYMLAGGTDASNTDPYASGPAANNHWIKTGPHLMLAGADAAFYDAYPKDTDPDTSRPYVMWAGTPYQHLMVPVQ